MKYEEPIVHTESNHYGHYIYILYKNKKYINDDEIAGFLGITRTMYNSILTSNNGVVNIVNEIYFSEQDEVINAIIQIREKMDAFMVMKSLSI